MRVLVVEDNPLLVDVWEDALAEAGFSVESASSCADAAQSLLRTRFDVCIMDLHVTDGTTHGLADWVKVRSPHTTVIAVTGSPVAVNGELTTEHCYDFVFRKPLPIDDLIAVSEHAAVTAV